MTDYVKNPTWVDGSGGGTPVNAAALNNIEAGIFDAHYQPAVRVFHSANQSIINSTNVALAFDTERFDVSGGAASTMHDTVTNNSRLTCRIAGKYLITAHVSFAGSAGGAMRQVFIRLNGATQIATDQRGPSSTQVISISLTTLWDMAVNDYVEANVFQDSGGALNVLQVNAISPEFSMVRVA